ncbi:MAG: hypothetical protein PF589_03860 [Gammaproteobacteria bacterium]|jgi:hypothetical protein|nr:hypothetical protein [Gammaproteobacteria bacterium]
MSLLIFAMLLGVGVIMLIVVRSYGDENYDETIPKTAAFLFTHYLLVLLIASLACPIVGTYMWLRHGEWFTISPVYLMSLLEDKNSIKILLLSDTTWAGIQQAGNWYIQQNIGWSFILALIILFVALDRTQ